MILRSLPIPIAIAGLLSASIASVTADGAELRTSVRHRPIQRTVSIQAASFQEAVEAAETFDLIVESEMLTVGPDPLIEPCDSCGDAGCAADCLLPCERWATFEYLLWWRRGQSFPPLVTTSPADGVLPDGTVLFGDETIGEDARPGGRVSIGGWLDGHHTIGVEGRFFALGHEQLEFAADSTEFPVLARPFRDPVTMTQEATLLAQPGFTGPGNVNISSNSDVLGGDVLFRWQAAQSATTKMDFLIGYQFARIDEDFNINSFSTAINVPGIDPGTTFTTDEQFLAENHFHGAQLGLAAAYVHCDWQVDLLAKLAFGNMREVVTIAGQTTIVTPGPGSTTSTTPGPLAGEANSGRHVNDQFAVSPELGLNIRYSLSECLDLAFGYSFIYWSRIAQAGRQIDPMLNDPPPAFSLNSGSYWVHGLTAGASFRF